MGRGALHQAARRTRACGDLDVARARALAAYERASVEMIQFVWASLCAPLQTLRALRIASRAAS